MAKKKNKAKKIDAADTSSVVNQIVTANVEAVDSETVDIETLEAMAHDIPSPSSVEIAIGEELPIGSDSIQELLAPDTIEIPADVATIVDSNLITDAGEIENVLEAIIFAAPKAITILKIKNLLRSFSYDVSQAVEILDRMIAGQESHGFQLVKVGGGYQYRTHHKHTDVMQKLFEDRPTKLSGSALEVLSIVAYKQPITRSEIDSVRGVDSGHLMKGLLEKNLIRTQGHAETPGRPMLYGTAPYFLEVFGLNSLDDLPALEEMNRELVGDSNTSGDSGLTLSSEAGAQTDSSGLSANPDRGAFDESADEVFDDPDFGEKDRALEKPFDGSPSN